MLVAWSTALAGCATIHETRLEGPARPEPSAHAEVTTESRAGAEGATECREVTRTGPMVKDVVVRRSFADETQEHDAAVAMLLGAGSGALVFAQSQQTSCSGGACSAPSVSAVVVAAIAAVPLAFVAYNAVHVQDRRLTVPVAPEVTTGEWHACSAPRP
ncbi:MAG: hypothetical protein ABSE49_04025 [Polyangiaceae bacterium]